MTNLFDAKDIERIVGVKRHRWDHYGRAVSAEQKMYILHPEACLEHRRDLRKCHFSRALDNGLNPVTWKGYEDRPVRLAAIKRREGYLLIPHPVDWSTQTPTRPLKGAQ